MIDTFLWHDHRLPYWDHPYNNTRNNERAVEVPIVGAWFLDGDWDGPGLEVGNVLGHYSCPAPRRIVDLYEQAEGVENMDVLDIKGTFPWIVSVSTIEHVGCDDGRGDPSAAVDAVRHLRSLLEPDGRMLITVPFTANPALDEAIAAGTLGVTRQATLHRLADHPDAVPTWRQADDPVAPLPSPPLVRSAGAVWIGEW